MGQTDPMASRTIFATSLLCFVCFGAPVPENNSTARSLKTKLGLNEDEQIFASYVVDWAHYRKEPYKWSPSDYAGIAKRTDVALYSFIYFCPPAGTNPMPYWASYPYGQCNDSNEYQLLSVDPIDGEGISEIVQMGPKVVLSIGGWNFPSEYFSKMAATPESRAKFVASVKSWMSQHGVAGIDIDWEYPCSAPRTDPVKITCSKFQTVHDKGGSCPEDSVNLLALVKDLRSGLGADAILSIASQASQAHADQMNLAAVSEYIDAWHVMSYDYAVSDLPDGSSTSPNAPLYTPPAASGAVQMSINQTVMHYLARGVPKEKIMVGLPLYAHTWYVPGLQGDAWKRFGLNGTLQGECCGPMKATFGAQPGQGCQLCGSMMWTEILASKPQTYYDNQTQTMIGYFTGAGADAGYTAPGTWITYNDVRSAQAVVEYEKDMGLAGVFIYSADMDTKEYQMMNAIADALGKAPGPTPPTPPTPPAPPSPPPAPTPAPTTKAPTPPPPPPPTPAPTPVAPACDKVGQSALCKIACGGTCRGFPPGFGSPGCITQGYCAIPPGWAKHSVCTC